MQIYTIGQTLQKVPAEPPASALRVCLCSYAEWEPLRRAHPDPLPPAALPDEISTCKVEMRLYSLNGTFYIPEQRGRRHHKCFAYCVWDRQITFIDDSGTAAALVEQMAQTRGWKSPSLGRFFSEFMEQLIAPDARYLDRLEDHLVRLEDSLAGGAMELEHFDQRLLAVRRKLLEYQHYYMQLADMGAELEENEAGFFSDADTHLFHLFAARTSRLKDHVQMLRDYSMQVRELYQSQVDLRQNNIMRVLTVVTTVFMPLTLIAGWYGMNFSHMPELGATWGYPLIIAVSAAVVLAILAIFKKKKYI